MKTEILDRNSRICIYTAGGFSGGLMTEPVDITLDRVPDDCFQHAREIIEWMLSGKAPQEPLWETMSEEERLDFADKTEGDYQVLIGAHGTAFQNLTAIYNGKFLYPPPHVLELETILKKHARPTDLILKP